MALTGDEKRIQALFSELSFEDHSHVPSFARLWNRAERTGPAPVHNFRNAAVVLTLAALIILTATAFAAWSWSTTADAPTQNAINVAPPITPPSPKPEASNNTALSTTPRRSLPHRKNRTERYRSTQLAVREATLLSSWQSPTQLFMNSPASVSFNSLPQLNESVEELKQFLPRNTDLTKESNQ